MQKNLSVDFAVFNEQHCGEGVLLISSGVHGVEGFAGSAIQLGIVREIETFSDKCVVMIHAVNPFGFSEYRRNT